jgi:glycosyltransferase involved in cell wall biosynthesis
MARVVIDARDARAGTLRGWGRYTRELVAAMRRRTPEDLELAVLDDGGRGPEVVFEQVTLPRALRRMRADAVHVPNCFLPLRRPCPGAVTIHDLAFEEHVDDFGRRTGLKYRLLTPRAARSAEVVICPSEFSRHDVSERYGVALERIRVVPEAPALPAGEEQPPEGPYMLAVGDVRRKKNLVRLVEAFGVVRRHGLPHRLVLAGLDGGAAAEVRAAAGDSPVELTGYVSDARLDALMRGAALLVHPSLHEGFGLVLLEAMARGCPVAAARATALPETAGGAAELFDPLDPEDMAAAMERVLVDQGISERLVSAGRRRAAEFSWDRTAEITLGIYRELVE